MECASAILQLLASLVKSFCRGIRIICYCDGMMLDDLEQEQIKGSFADAQMSLWPVLI